MVPDGAVRIGTARRFDTFNRPAAAWRDALVPSFCRFLSFLSRVLVVLVGFFQRFVPDGAANLLLNRC